MLNRKSAFAATLLALGTVTAGTAHAGDVHWSIGVNLPQVGTVISNEPVYQAPRPVYHAPRPVYVQPAPVVVYRPAPPVVYQPAPVYAPGYYGHPGVIRSGWTTYPGHRHDRHDRHHRYGHRHDHHDRDDHRGDRDDRRDDHRKHH
jgi:hypothetical protein